MNSQLANGWAAWHELWSAKTHAMERLRKVTSRFRTPQLASAFAFWVIARQLMSHAKLVREANRTGSQLQNETRQREELASQLHKAETALALVTAEKQDLMRRLPGLTLQHSEAERVHAEQLAREREGRVDLLARQITRRIMYSGMASGWTAWVEMWRARRDAMRQLRKAANRLKWPAIANSFGKWHRWPCRGGSSPHRASDSLVFSCVHHVHLLPAFAVSCTRCHLQSLLLGWYLLALTIPPSAFEP